MFISTIDVEVARERHQDYIREARAANLRKSVQGERRFGRQTDRMAQATGAWVRSMIVRVTPLRAGGDRRFA